MPEPTAEQPEVLTATEARAATKRPRPMIIVLIVSVLATIAAFWLAGAYGQRKLDDGVAIGGEPAANEQLNERIDDKDPGIAQRDNRS